MKVLRTNFIQKPQKFTIEPLLCGSFVRGKEESMTQNQIAYWNLQESMRTNKANEAIKSQEARTKEGELQERGRSNRMQEALKGDLQTAQKQRWMYQNVTDASNALTNARKASNDGASMVVKLIGGLK